jgi:hypothetical protein
LYVATSRYDFVILDLFVIAGLSGLGKRRALVLFLGRRLKFGYLGLFIRKRWYVSDEWGPAGDANEHDDVNLILTGGSCSPFTEDAYLKYSIYNLQFSIPASLAWGLVKHRAGSVPARCFFMEI